MTKNFSVIGSKIALLFIGSQIFFSLISIGIINQSGPFSGIVSAMFEVLSYGLPIVVYFFMFRNEEGHEFLKLKPVSLSTLGIAILIAVLSMPVLMLFSAISTLFFENNVTKYFELMSGEPLSIMLLRLALIPAVMEEILFRGVIFSTMKNLSLKKACFLTGFIFALCHLSPQQFLYAFLGGTFFAYMVYITDSIIPSILTHLTINSMQVLTFSLSSNIETGAEVSIFNSILSLFLLSLPVIPVISVLLLILSKKNPKKAKKLKLQIEDRDLWENESFPLKKEYEEKFISLPLIVLCIVFLVFSFISASF